MENGNKNFDRVFRGEDEEQRERVMDLANGFKALRRSLQVDLARAHLAGNEDLVEQIEFRVREVSATWDALTGDPRLKDLEKRTNEQKSDEEIKKLAERLTDHLKRVLS